MTSVFFPLSFWRVDFKDVELKFFFLSYFSGGEILHLLNEEFFLKVACTPRKSPKCFYILPKYKI